MMLTHPQLDVLTAFLRDTHGGTRRSCVLADDPWEPLAVPISHTEYRRIYAVEHGYLGAGNYGAVTLVVASVPWTLSVPASERTAAGLRYVLAALKTSIGTNSHLDEAVSAAAINEIIEAGVSPALVRVIDAFAIAMFDKALRPPPRAWCGYWKHFDAFAEKIVPAPWLVPHEHTVVLNKRRPHARSEDNPSCVLRNGATLAFSFYEASTYTLDTGHRPTAVVSDVRLRESPGARSANDPGRVRYNETTHLLADLYQRVQAIHALHAACMVDCDIHTGNYIRFAALDARLAPATVHQLTGGAQAVADRTRYLGVLGRDRPALSSEGPLAFLLPLADTPHESYVKLPADAPRVALVDYGAVKRCRVYGSMTLQQATVRLRRHREAKTPLPTNLVSDNAFHYGDQTGRPVDTGAWVPPAIEITYPTTHGYTRAPEQMNPRAAIPHLVIHSTRTDVYSVCATLASVVLGFDIFRGTLPVRTIGDIHACEGIPVEAFREAKPTPAGHRGSTGTLAAYRMQGTPLCSTLRIVSETKQDELRRSSGTHHGSSLFAVADFEAPAKRIYDFVVAYFHAHPAAHSHFLGKIAPREPIHGDDLRNQTRGICARIEATGLPTAEATRGTFFHDLFEQLRADTEHVVANARGWLRGVLRYTLLRRYNVLAADVDAFLELLMDGLSWDPAQRPPIRAFLLSPLFRSLYCRFDESFRPGSAWSADWPRDTNRAHTTVTPVGTPVATTTASPLASDPLPYLHERVPFPQGVMSRVEPARVSGDRLCRATSMHVRRLNQFLVSRTRDACLYLCERDAPRIHPEVSERLYFLNNVLGRLDAYRGTPRVNIAGKSYYEWRVPGLRLTFASESTLTKALAALQRCSRLPGWILDHSTLPPPPQPSTTATPVHSLGASDSHKRSRSPTVAEDADESEPKRRRLEAGDRDNLVVAAAATTM